MAIFCCLCALIGQVAATDLPGILVDVDALNRGKAQSLNGFWWFEFGEHTSLEDIPNRVASQNLRVIDVPKPWNDAVKDLSDSPYQHGIATFVLPLTLPQQLNRPISINALFVSSGYQIYWLPSSADSSPVLLGSSGDWEKGRRSGLESNFYHFPLTSDGLLVLYIAKSNVYKGGIRQPIELRATDTLKTMVQKEWILRSILVGGLLVMLVHYLVQYYYAREHLSALMMSIVCAVAVVRSITASGMMALFTIDMFPSLSTYYLSLRLEYLTIVFAPTSFFLFLHSMIPGLLPLLLRKIAIIVTVLFAAALLLFSLEEVTKNLAWLQLYMLFWVGVSMGYTLYAAMLNMPYARQILFNSSIVAAGVLNDIFASNTPLYNVYVVEFTLFLFLFLQAQLVGSKLRESLAESTRLSEEKAILQAAHKRAVQASELDHLTGLYNRLALTSRLNALTQDNRGSYDTIGIILFDLDHFKSINDTYGHNIGDEILTFVASILHSHSLRTSDFKCRYGGEEFLVVLPGATLAKTKSVAEDIRLRIAQSIPYENEEIQIKVTASFGVALFNQADSQTPDEVINSADLALYKAKGRGRNCVEIHPTH